MTKPQIDGILSAYGGDKFGGDSSLREFHMTANYHISVYRYEVLGWCTATGCEEILMFRDKNTNQELLVDVVDINQVVRETYDGKYDPTIYA